MNARRLINTSTKISCIIGLFIKNCTIEQANEVCFADDLQFYRSVKDKAKHGNTLTSQLDKTVIF